MEKDRDLTDEINAAELRRLIRMIGFRRRMAMNKIDFEKDQFVLFHFAQQLAYEECITLIRQVFAEELGEDEEE